MGRTTGLMRGTTLAAIGSLAGLAVSVTLYTYYPLPQTGISWDSSDLWISLTLLVLGLICFIVLLITGLITLLNWNSEPRGR